MNVLCPCCLGKGTYPAKINDRKRGCYMGEAQCPCCEGAKMVPEPVMRDWVAKFPPPSRTGMVAPDECNSFVGDGPTYSCLLCGRLGIEHAALK